MKQYIIGGLIGAVLIFVLLKYVLKKTVVSDDSKTMENLLSLAQTEQAKKLMKTSEFGNMMNTKEFGTFVKDFGTEQLVNFIQI